MNAVKVFEGSVNLKKGDHQITLKFTDSFIDNHLGGTRDIDEIEDAILVVCEHDFIYNSDMEITELKKHQQEQDAC